MHIQEGDLAGTAGKLVVRVANGFPVPPIRCLRGSQPLHEYLRQANQRREAGIADLVIIFPTSDCRPSPLDLRILQAPAVFAHIMGFRTSPQSFWCLPIEFLDLDIPPLRSPCFGHRHRAPSPRFRTFLASLTSPSYTWGSPRASPGLPTAPPRPLRSAAGRRP